MSDDTKVWLGFIGLALVVVVTGFLLILNHNNHQAALRQAACVAPESVACALAVRQ